MHHCTKPTFKTTVTTVPDPTGQLSSALRTGQFGARVGRRQHLRQKRIRAGGVGRRVGERQDRLVTGEGKTRHGAKVRVLQGGQVGAVGGGTVGIDDCVGSRFFTQQCGWAGLKVGKRQCQLSERYHVRRSTPVTQSKCPSRLSTGKPYCRASAAIQVSLAGIGLLLTLRSSRTRP